MPVCASTHCFLQLSALEGGRNQNKERLVQRTHGHADPQIKHIHLLTPICLIKILALSQYCTVNLLLDFRFSPKTGLGNGSSMSKMHLSVVFPFPPLIWTKLLNLKQVINAGDALEFLSAGFYRATIHRYCFFSFFQVLDANR